MPQYVRLTLVFVASRSTAQELTALRAASQLVDKKLRVCEQSLRRKCNEKYTC